MNFDKLNPLFQTLDIDYLYHLGLDSSMDLPALFGDVKYVIFTRSMHIADRLASKFASKYFATGDEEVVVKIVGKKERYHIHKIANTLILSHGVGSPSLLICINETIKLLWHAKATNVNFLRFGESGGVGCSGMVLANTSLDARLEAQWSNIEFGKTYSYSTKCSDIFAKSIYGFASNMEIHSGYVLSSNGFYSQQARSNGALEVGFSESERIAYLDKLYQHQVRAVDMESGCFFALCNCFEIPACALLVTLVDRLQETSQEPEVMNKEMLKQALDLIINYILYHNEISVCE